MSTTKETDPQEELANQCKQQLKYAAVAKKLREDEDLSIAFETSLNVGEIMIDLDTGDIVSTTSTNENLELHVDDGSFTDQSIFSVLAKVKEEDCSALSYEAEESTVERKEISSTIDLAAGGATDTFEDNVITRSQKNQDLVVVPTTRLIILRRCAPIAAIILAAAGIALIITYLWNVQNGPKNSLTTDLPSHNDFLIKNLRWGSKRKNGLELNFVNSLNTDWHDLYQETFEDWNSSPSLSLASSLDSGTLSCDHIQGQLRICNGEFGETGWIGINVALYYEYNGGEDNVIIASVAKMNDSYLNGAPYLQRKYALCHEIGHGFGLSHRKEDGTCMIASTNQFERNKSPDSLDFERLRSKYGDFTNRFRRRRMKRELDKISGNVSGIALDYEYRQGRLLHKSTHSEIYLAELDKGLKALTSLLLY